MERPIAHRALHGPGAPENSRAAVAAAIEAGYGIELDLQLSSNGVPVVFHDALLSRMTSADGAVRARTDTELGEIKLAGGDEGIPTFAEILQQVGGQVPLLVELKDQSGNLGESDGRFEAAVAEAGAAYAGDLAYMSFNPSLAAGMARAAPERPRGLVTEDFVAGTWPLVTPERRAVLNQIGALEEVSAAFVSHDWRSLDMPRIAELAAQGLPILCWTVKSPADEAVARRRARNITFEGYRPALTP
ncbi:MAG: glycerophosphodiester phosphodiesterase family protein [Pseudomonadota bacterium]